MWQNGIIAWSTEMKKKMFSMTGNMKLSDFILCLAFFVVSILPVLLNRNQWTLPIGFGVYENCEWFHLLFFLFVYDMYEIRTLVKINNWVWLLFDLNAVELTPIVTGTLSIRWKFARILTMNQRFTSVFFFRKIEITQE